MPNGNVSVGATDPITAADIQLLVSSGFLNVRLCVAPENIIARYSSAAAVQQELLAIDAAVDALIAAGLAVDLDFHADQAYRDSLYAQNNAGQELIATWSMLAQRYASRNSEMLFFEVMNEPSDFDANTWWTIQGQAIQAIRQHAPNNTIFAAAVESVNMELIENSIPYADTDVVYVFHDYNPMTFTDQGEALIGDAGIQNMHGITYPAWLPSNQSNLSTLIPASQAEAAGYIAEGWSADLMRQQIGRIAAWARRNGVYVLCNEFGALQGWPQINSVVTVDPDSRYRWLRDMRIALEEQGISWAMWDYYSAWGLVSYNGTTPSANLGVLAALGLAAWTQMEPPLALTTGPFTPSVGDYPNQDAAHETLVHETGKASLFGNVMATPDLNGDGIPDLVTTFSSFPNPPSNPIDVVISNGGGSLSNGASLFIGPVPQTVFVEEIVTGHFDRTGRPGLFFAELGGGPSGGQSRLVLPSGSTNYQDASANLPQQNAATWNAAAGDVDGDGIDDLVLFSAAPIGMQLLYDNGSGLFQVENQRLPATLLAPGVVFDAGAFVPRPGSEIPDLVVFGSSTSYFLQNNGTGDFSIASSLPLPPSSAFTGSAFAANVAVGDLDNNGQMDLVVAWTNQDVSPSSGSYIQILINNGDGTFTDQTAARIKQLTVPSGVNHIYLAPLNSSDRLDLLIELVGGQPVVMRNQGGGVFVDGTGPTTQGGRITVSDITGAGVNSIVEAGMPGQYYIYFGQRWFDTPAIPVPQAGGAVTAPFPGASSASAVFTGAPWVSGASTTDNSGTVNLQVAANPSPYDRSNVVRAAGSLMRVVQAGSGSATLSASTAQIRGTGGSGQVSVSGSGTSTGWIVSSDSTWLTPSPQALSSSGSVTFTAQPNSSALPRTGVIMIGDQAFTVTQGGSASSGPPSFTSDGVVDSWNYSTNVTAGEWVTIFGTQLAASTVQWNPQVNGLIATTLGGTTVLFNNVPAPLSYVSPTQVAALIPAGTASGHATIVIKSQGLASSPVTVESDAAHSALYAIPLARSSPLQLYVTAVDPITGELVGSPAVDSRVTRGALPGETLDLYAIGLGPTQSPVPADQLFTGAFPTASLPAIRIGSANVTPQFADLISPGLYQMRITVPNLPSGETPIVVSSVGVDSANNVFLNIAQ